MQAGQAHQRVLSLDLLRVLAMMAVVLIHVCVPVVLGFGQLSPADWWTGNLLDSFSRWSVPVFVMISGAVLLGKKNEEPLRWRAVRQFWVKRLWRLGLPLLLATVLFAVYYHLFRGDPLSVPYVLHQVIFRQPYAHLYFLWILLGLAVVTPWLQSVVRQSSASSLAALTFLFLLVTIFWVPRAFVFAIFLPYLGYSLAGTLFQRLPITYGASWLAASAAALSGVTIALGTWLAYTGVLHLRDPLALYEYTNLLVCVFSLTVFILMQQLNGQKGVQAWLSHHARFLVAMSELSFGVYILHPIVIDVLVYGAGLDVFRFGNVSAGIVIQWAVTLVLSVALSYGVQLGAGWVSVFFRLAQPTQKPQQ